MEINKCRRPRFDELVAFLLQYGYRLWHDDQTVVLEGVSKKQYVVHLFEEQPMGYVFDNTLVIPEEV